MTDQEEAIARHQMLVNVPSSRCADRADGILAPVSFSLLDISGSGVTVRFVDAQGQLTDIFLNNVVASALAHCMGSARQFSDTAPSN
ncbi:hypothetical protein [Paracoccus aestuariivivens]|uniref:Uncharacterized protein n=1 Tax=Paracoccus aestuariivivens TaxID=1820333 RepID=A0A6L6J8Q3_9RHOB|nr:hypothetical protein [Paracoccus aestuariivivens]MTH77129.1 hypothetical protein [Paracoccus aestuariivivens]